MNDIVTGLGIQWKVIIAQIINFGILMVVLYLLLYKPIVRALDKRKKMAEENLKTHEDLEVKKEKIKEEEDQVLRQASEKGQEIVKTSEAEAEKVKSHEITEARQKATVIINKSKEEAEREKAKVFAEAGKEMSEMVKKATEKVLAQKVSSQDDEKLIAETLKQLEKEEI